METVAFYYLDGAYKCEKRGNMDGRYVRAEVARQMHDALEQIAAHDPETCNGLTPRDCVDAMREIARTALAKAKSRPSARCPAFLSQRGNASPLPCPSRRRQA